MPATLIFVIVVLMIGAALVTASSLVGARRRAIGRQLDGHVRGFGRR